MRALCPALQAVPANPAEDAAALARLMFWARRWGPFSATDGDDGLVIDTTGVAHLFGGEDSLLADMQTRFARAGLTARVALAPTWGAAWGLARYGADRPVCRDLTDLHPLPVAALRLSDDTLLLLRRLGLRRIGDLAAIPRLPLMRRFARAPIWDNPLTRLDQAMAGWDPARPLLLCAEAGPVRPVAAALAGLPPGPGAILTGPEGGFAKDELDGLLNLPFVAPVGLGPRILRADTAALAALACWQALAGDWAAGGADVRPPFRFQEPG